MQENYKEKINNKAILVTGGTGSFGNSVIGSLLKYNPKRIIIFSRDEKKQFDMRNRYDNPTLKFVVGDVRDKYSVENVMEGVDYVFHAAALKQVPTCEFFPIEAVKTNILGANNVIDTAVSYGIKRIVILSTDKAVYPINAMGMTKAVMEKVMISKARDITNNGNITDKKDTILCGVRYGNVLCSRGSVVPYFVSQLKHNEQLSVTNLKMTRFLLRLPDAVGLVLYGLVHGESGHMYIRKSPACTLETLAKAVCKIFNYKKGYKEVGIRAGEKMHETLVSGEELLRSTDLKEYYKIPPDAHGLDYNKYFSRGKKIVVDTISSYTSENTERLDVSQTITLLLTLPEIREELKSYNK